MLNHSVRRDVASRAVLLAIGLACVTPLACRSREHERTLTLGAFSTLREAYDRAIIPAFQRHWRMRTGETVNFRRSYQGSGGQSRAIVSGFEADVAVLSLPGDIDRIARAGLITHDWRAGPAGGMVTRSIVAIAVRRGNPRGIHGWDDLRRPGLSVLTPDVRTSGGAMWNIAALYGAALRADPASAQAFLAAVLRNVSTMDRGARESMITFERGIGDAAITYESEVLVGRRGGQTYELVTPRSTILIENPAAVVDAYATAHGNRDLANAFVEFLHGAEAQRAFAARGLRPVHAEVAREVAVRYRHPADLFTIGDLGGWAEIQRTLFLPNARYDRAIALAANSTHP